MSSTILVSLYGLITAVSTGIHASSGSFESVADEIIENILLCLTPFDLNSALRLNLRINKIIHDSVKLKYYFMLHTSGQLESSNVGPVSERLTKLRERQKRATGPWDRRTVSTDYTGFRILGVWDGVLFCVSRKPATGSEYLRYLELATCNTPASSEDIWRETPIPGRIAGIAYAHDLICIVCQENG